MIERRREEGKREEEEEERGLTSMHLLMPTSHSLTVPSLLALRACLP